MLEDWVFTSTYSKELLLSHFETKSLKGFGVERMPMGVIAAGAALHYLKETQHNKTSHIASITRIEEDNYVWMDHFTIRNLELLQATGLQGISLLDILDQTVSPMGARMLRRWMVLPLKDQKTIEDRLNIVDYFNNEVDIADDMAIHIKQMGDLERLISKVATARICPREVVQLKKALAAIDPIVLYCNNSENISLRDLASQLNPCKPIQEKIGQQLQEDAPVQIIKGNVIADAVSPELDELREISTSAKDYLEHIRQRETERTGIPSLKIAFNNVFGYYLEVRNTHKDKVPEQWIRKQTLTSAERYVTEELKMYEEKILGAEEKILNLESEIFSQLIEVLLPNIENIVFNAKCIAYLDVIHGLAHVSKINNYSKPIINDSLKIDIKDGRHPVIEQFLPVGEAYIPNDIFLDNKLQQIMMITGPNMSGKSALLRQTALILIMAQIGCFVPAKYANIGVIDKLFTRVGANDNISSGESTFMVEMNETSSIMNNISSRSLILLDEIGRGTSTYDGISIAWSIAEFLHENPKFQPKTMFATHYHELNNMTKSFNRIKNYNVSVKEIDKKIHFIRKLVEGGSEHSFGIHVAKVAGMPQKIISKAEKILKNLELDKTQNSKKEISTIENEDHQQLSFFQLDDPILSDIRNEIDNLDVNSLTPVEALVLLNDIKKKLGS